MSIAQGCSLICLFYFFVELGYQIRVDTDDAWKKAIFILFPLIVVSMIGAFK